MSQELLKLATSPEIQPLFDEVNTTFGDFSSTETEISDLMKRVNVFFPDFKAPEINTLVTGFGGIDMAQGEDVIFIGLDYFLGPKAKFIPNKYPNYILKYFTKERLPYKVALMLSKRFNETDPKDKSLLSYMVYYGKSYYFASKTLPCLKEDEIVEYTTQELKDVHDFTSIIWSHFINKQLFYTTDAKAVTKYVDERPAVNEIGERCPGRIGRWLGYEIVKKYMENHPDLSLQDLMKETNAQKIFKQSKYKPGA